MSISVFTRSCAKEVGELEVQEYGMTSRALLLQTSLHAVSGRAIQTASLPVGVLDDF